MDPTGTWRTIETAHFDVHARAEHRDLALRAAGEAEAAWTAYAALLPPPTSRIDLVVADNTDEPNGYATTYPRPRIVIYALPPAGDLQLEAYDRWLRLVVTHELAHIFHLDLARGWWSAARSVLGRAPFLFPNEYAPAWMREGLAVFYESRLTGAGRLDGAYHRAVVGAAANETAGMALDEASTASPKWPSGLRPYAFGSRFMGAAAERFGDSVVARYATELAGRPLPYLQLASAWRHVAGVSLVNSWNDALVAPETGDRRPETGIPTILMRGLRSAVAPRVSADGTRLLVAFDNGRDAMRLVELRRGSGSWRRLARLNGANGLSWASDGGAIVSQLEFTDLYNLRADLWAIAPDGHARRLTDGERLREPDVAPDGAIVAVRATAGRTELALLSVRPSDRPAVLTAPDSAADWASPRFNPAGTLIAAVRVDRGWHDIVLLDRAGTLVRQVTRDSVADLMPAFSPDGRWLVWSREVDGVPQIVGVRVTAEGGIGDAARFTSEPFAAYAPAPANDTLYYMSYHADGFRLVAVPLDGAVWPLPALRDAPIAGRRSPVAEVRAEHGYRPSLLPRYWMPQLYGEPGGVWVGAFSSGTDALERHTWSASLMLGLGSLAGQVNAQVAYLHAGPGRALFDVSASHTPQSVAGVGCCDRDDELRAGLTMVRRRWRTQAQTRFGTEYTNDFFAERVGASLSGQLSHTITPALATGTQWGARLGATLRYRHRVGEALEATELSLRLSTFAPDSARRFARRVFGARLAWGTIAGNDPIEFSVGGVSGGGVAVLPGVTLGGGTRTFPVRGLAPGALSGRRALGSSFEIREPIALVGRGLGLFPLGLDRVSATLFADVGAAWSPRYCPSYVPGPGGPVGRTCTGWALSVGPELSTDLVLGFDVPLRFRLGLALAGTSAGNTVSGGFASYVALGSSF